MIRPGLPLFRPIGPNGLMKTAGFPLRGRRVVLLGPRDVFVGNVLPVGAHRDAPLRRDKFAETEIRNENTQPRMAHAALAAGATFLVPFLNTVASVLFLTF